MPFTEAGRALRLRYQYDLTDVEVGIVEAEAYAAGVAAARAELVKLRPPDRFVALDGTYDQGFSERAALAAIDAITPKETP